MTRGIPALRPSFLILTLSVNAAWIQQVSVPNPKVKDVPTLWISSSFVSWETDEGGGSFETLRL